KTGKGSWQRPSSTSLIPLCVAEEASVAAALVPDCAAADPARIPSVKVSARNLFMNPDIKMRQAKVFACLIIRGLYSIVELQSELDVSGRLGAGDLSHRRTQTHVRCVELHVVKGVDEVAAELQPEAFCHLDVFMEAQVQVGVMRPSQSAELRGAIAKCTDGRVGKVAVIVNHWIPPTPAAIGAFIMLGSELQL